MKLARTCAGLLLALCAAVPVLAAFPERAITIVVPFPPGGPTDITGRAIASALSRSLRTSVVVENVGGGGGAIGAAKVAKSRADGYTLLFTHTGLATAEAVNPKLPFKVLNDLEYLGVISEVPLVLLSRASAPAANYPELVQWLRENEGRVTMANAGLGSASYLCALMFSDSIRMRFINIPYKGTGPAMSDLLGGQIDLMCDQTISATPQIEARGVKVHAVTTMKRVEQPEVLKATPTLNELGLARFNFAIWQALYAPRDTPTEIVARLNAALRETLKDPEFVRSQRTLGAVLVDDVRLTSAGHKAFMKSEMVRLCEVIRKSDAAREEGWTDLKCARD